MRNVSIKPEQKRIESSFSHFVAGKKKKKNNTTQHLHAHVKPKWNKRMNARRIRVEKMVREFDDSKQCFSISLLHILFE